MCPHGSPTPTPESGHGLTSTAQQRPPRPGPRDLRRRLVAAFAGLIALLLVILAVSLAVSRGINASATDKYVDDAIPLKAAVQDLVLQVVTEQSAVRGYVITRSPVSLRTYRAARAEARAQLAYIRGHLDGHPVLAGLIDDASRRIVRLEAFYEAETDDDAAAPAGLAGARRRVLDGTRRFAEFRRVADLMLADTDRFVAEAKAAQDRRAASLTIALLLLGALALGTAAVLAIRVPRRVGETMQALDEERAATALAARRAGTLQRMTAALATALDEDAVIDVLGREVGGTPGIDEVVIGRPDPGGERVEVRTLGATRAEDSYIRLPADAGLPVPFVARNGEPIFFPTPQEALARFPALAAIRGQDMAGSWAVMPMRTGRRPMPVLALRFDVARAFTAAERTFLLTIADQCSQALERVRLHQEQVHIAHALQQSLLPAGLPRVRGLEIAARYGAAESAQEVGGDFYDVFQDGDGHLAVVVGDACGKAPRPRP